MWEKPRLASFSRLTQMYFKPRILRCLDCYFNIVLVLYALLIHFMYLVYIVLMLFPALIQRERWVRTKYCYYVISFSLVVVFLDIHDGHGQVMLSFTGSGIY